MNPRGASGKIAVLMILFAVTGCVSSRAGQKAPSIRHAPDIARVMDAFVMKKLESAEACERENKPVTALREYRIILAVDPEHPLALEGINRLTVLLDKEAQARYERGLELNDQGKYLQARREFLAALRLRPTHPEIPRMMVHRKRVTSIRYVVHHVLPGENLIKIAQKYYGDYRKFPEIARYNKLEDATKLLVNQELKIPEIDGYPLTIKKPGFLVEEERKGPELKLWDWASLEVTRDAAQASEGNTKDIRIEEHGIRGVKYFEKKMYSRAVEEFDRILSLKPDDKMFLDYKFQAEFHQAEGLFQEKDYLEARDKFLKLLQEKPDCYKCYQYVEEIEENYKETHYKKAMRLYNQERLTEAIREWQLVMAMDTDYKEVRYLIKKALKILANLEDLKTRKQ